LSEYIAGWEVEAMRAYCKYVENSPILEFGPSTNYFNHASGNHPIRLAAIRKQFTDSMEVEVEANGQNIENFKLTNQSLLTWDDHWVEGDAMVDPRIININLQRNRLVYVNINLPRPSLQTLNLEGNTDLQHLYVHEAPNLQCLDISGCEGLRYISLGLNYSLREVIARDCKMSTETLRQLLRDFRPVYTASANVRGVGMFRKQYDTVLDLRGNDIDWGDRRIASKLRMLLTNNWVVKWDADPPPQIIPPSLYRFFVESRV
jgi:hypothetical protein